MKEVKGVLLMGFSHPQPKFANPTSDSSFLNKNNPNHSTTLISSSPVSTSGRDRRPTPELIVRLAFEAAREKRESIEHDAASPTAAGSVHSRRVHAPL